MTLQEGYSMAKIRLLLSAERSPLADPEQDLSKLVEASRRRRRAATTRRVAPALLKGFIFTENGPAMTPSHARTGWRFIATTCRSM